MAVGSRHQHIDLGNPVNREGRDLGSIESYLDLVERGAFEDFGPKEGASAKLHLSV